MVVCAYANDRKGVPIHPFHGTYLFIPSQERSCYNGCIIVFIPRYVCHKANILYKCKLFLIFSV